MSTGDTSGPMKLFLVAGFSPVVETLVMAGVLGLLLRWLAGWQAVIASSALWGIAHSLATPLWGAVIWWPFLIFSTLYVTWRPRGFWRAVGVVVAVHVLQNLFPAILLVMGGLGALGGILGGTGILGGIVHIGFATIPGDVCAGQTPAARQTQPPAGPIPPQGRSRRGADRRGVDPADDRQDGPQGPAYRRAGRGAGQSGHRRQSEPRETLK